MTPAPLFPDDPLHDLLGSSMWLQSRDNQDEFAFSVELLKLFGVPLGADSVAVFQLRVPLCFRSS